MASHASWQTGGAGGVGGAGWDEAFSEQQSIENRLRRLMQQVEESERRYGEALDELQSRLNQLARSSDDARSTGGGDAATLKGLQEQVRGLVSRFEHEASTSLDDFERLGRAVMGGLDRGPGGLASGASATPFPSPFATEPPTPASTPFTFSSPFAPELPRAASPSFTFPATGTGPAFPSFPPLPDVDRDLSKRLVDMAHRLEHSVEETMTPKAIDTLNARIDTIGWQISDALRLATKPPSLEPLERQIADIARQLGQAQGELAKIGEIETALHRLIERMDGHAGQLTEVAARAATEAAHLVSGEAKLDAATAARLHNMHRDLKAMGAHANAADNRLAGIIEAVHDALKQLARQVERSSSHAAAQTPRASSAESLDAQQDEQPRSEEANGSGSTTDGFKRSASRPPFGRAKRGQTEANAADPDAGNADDLNALSPDRSLPGKPGRTHSEMEEDLVTAARRAAQAAALRAAERTNANKRKWASSGAFNAGMRQADARRVETTLRRGRPLLIVCAAVLLALSAVLLYGRLQTKSEPEPLPPAAQESAPPPSDSSRHSPLPGAAEKAPAGEPKNETPPATNPSSVAPDATPNPAGDRESAADEKFTNVAKSSYWPATVMKEPGQSEPAPVVEATPQAEPAAVQSIDEPALPPGVVFAVEEPAASH